MVPVFSFGKEIFEHQDTLQNQVPVVSFGKEIFEHYNSAGACGTSHLVSKFSNTATSLRQSVSTESHLIRKFSNTASVPEVSAISFGKETFEHSGGKSHLVSKLSNTAESGHITRHLIW
jgi:hypothetical protein